MAAPLTVEQTAAALQAAQATTTGTATGTGTASQPSGGVAGTSTDGGGGGPSSGLDPLEGHPPYVSWEERREPSERKPPRKSTGHSYCVKFFLVDTSGVEYLAAVGAWWACGARMEQGRLGWRLLRALVPHSVPSSRVPSSTRLAGEDQGDAHYLYEHRAGFPFLRANNKGVRGRRAGAARERPAGGGIRGGMREEVEACSGSGAGQPSFASPTRVYSCLPSHAPSHVDLLLPAPQEVRSWLESIIGRSKDRAGVHGHLVQVRRGWMRRGGARAGAGREAGHALLWLCKLAAF